MRGAAGAAQGPSGVASPRRRSQSRVVAASALGVPAPPPQPRPPRRRRPPAGVGGGVPQHPALSPPLRCAASFSAGAPAPPPPGLPPEWGGAAVPPPRPVPPRPRGRRTPGRWAFRARTDCPADRRTHAPALDAGIPRVGGGRGRARGGAAEGAEKEEGEETDRAEAPLALTRESAGAPNPRLGRSGTPGRKPGLE